MGSFLGLSAAISFILLNGILNTNSSKLIVSEIALEAF